MKDYLLQTIANNGKIFSLNCNPYVSKQLILLSRVNERFCYEAENGRIHGDGCYVDSSWVFNSGQMRMHLDKPFLQTFGNKTKGPLFDFYHGGNPIIEETTVNHLGHSYLRNINLDKPWATQFIYIRAALYYQLKNGNNNEAVHPEVGVFEKEYEQAKYLAEEFDIDGNWGSKNRKKFSNWDVSHSLLTTLPDSNALAFQIKNHCNDVRYAVGLFSLSSCNIILPYQFLKRSGFSGVRRVFFPPEDDIPIWGAEAIASQSVKDVILINEPSLLLFPQKTQGGAIAIGCLLGGVEAINQTDFSPLHGKNVYFTLLGETEKNIEFVVKVAAKCQRSGITPRILSFEGSRSSTFAILNQKMFNGHVLNVTKIHEISIPNILEIAQKYNINIPSELRSDFYGDITALLTDKTSNEIITPGILYSGDILDILVHDNIPYDAIAVHMGDKLSKGNDIFPNLLHTKSLHETSIMIDSCCNSTYSKLLNNITSHLHICDDRFMEQKDAERINFFKKAIGNSKVIIFIGQDLINDTTLFKGILKWCRKNNLTCIIFREYFESPKRPPWQRLLSNNMNIFSIDDTSFALIISNGQSLKLSFNEDENCFECEKLPSHIEKSFSEYPLRTLASSPIPQRIFDELSESSPEKRFKILNECRCVIDHKNLFKQ